MVKKKQLAYLEPSVETFCRQRGILAQPVIYLFIYLFIIFVRRSVPFGLIKAKGNI